uniref:Uncharacterized protein n=1 Tax=Rhizophora mucronata TaxID=61149 RepID=A0A2P2P4Q1_RHIMU
MSRTRLIPDQFSSVNNYNFSPLFEQNRIAWYLPNNLVAFPC